MGGNVLNVLMVATSYPSDEVDWRGRFIYDMVESLARNDRLNLQLWAPPGVMPATVHSALTNGDAVWLREILKQGGIAHLLRKRPVFGGVKALGLLLRLSRVYRDFAYQGGPAVAHVNWLQNALPLIGRRIPAVISVLGTDLAFLRLPGMAAGIRRMLVGRKAILAPNAEWMVPVLTRYFGGVAEIRPIPFGVHERWFAIKREPDSFCSGDWLVVSRVTRAKLGHLLSWGEGLFGKGRKLHLFGPMQEALELPAWLEYHGPTNPDALAGEWFPKVAGLLTLSTHNEGRPQVMIEAMAAGIPVVAIDQPAHRDLLCDGVTGCLVASMESLQSVLVELDDPARNRCLGEAARLWVAEAVGTWDDCAQRYARAYDDLLERV